MVIDERADHSLRCTAAGPESGDWGSELLQPEWFAHDDQTLQWSVDAFHRMVR